MPLQSQIYRYLERIDHQKHLDDGMILHYDLAAQDLRPWLWPKRAGKPVAPEELLNYRIWHDFKAPCCLCASNAARTEYTESDIYVAVDGEFWGEYVASCAADQCGYLVGIERKYAANPDLLFMKKYPVLPTAVDEHDILASVPVYKQPAKKQETTIDLLLRLDCWVQPGLTQDEFRGLIARCRCGLFTTRRALRTHTCAKPPQTVIDLTMLD